MRTFTLIIKMVAISLLFATSNGCKSYMKYKYGITRPGEETTEKLISFLEKQHFPEENQYIFSDSGGYMNSIRNPVFSKNLLSHMIFNSEGTLLQRDTAKCQWAGYNRIKSLSIDSAYEICGGLPLAQLLRKIRPFGKNPGRETVVNDPDFTIIVTWAKFLGKYNYRLFDLSEALKLNQTARIRIIWLNIDMLKSWELKPEQKLAIK
jgi:hypothetical protein